MFLPQPVKVILGFQDFLTKSDLKWFFNLIFPILVLFGPRLPLLDMMLVIFFRFKVQSRQLAKLNLLTSVCIVVLQVN